MLITLFIFYSCLFAQDVFTDKLQEAKTQLHHGYNTWNVDELQQSLALFERLLATDREPWLVHYYLGLNDYWLGTLYMGQNEKSKAKACFETAIEHLKNCQSLNETFPESYALVASCMGNQIGLTPWKGMILGPKSGGEIANAVKYGPENPRVWLLKGINTNFSPKTFGGGPEKALPELEKAVTLFESDSTSDPLYPSWGHDQAYAWIGLIQTELKNFSEAESALKNGLLINPQNGWIRHQLIPELEKKMNE